MRKILDALGTDRIPDPTTTGDFYRRFDEGSIRNLIAQLACGVRALSAPVDNLHSNWAYMVMTSLAWNLKAWWALMLPEKPGRWQKKHRAEKQGVLRMEFRTFVKVTTASF